MLLGLGVLLGWMIGCALAVVCDVTDGAAVVTFDDNDGALVAGDIVDCSGDEIIGPVFVGSGDEIEGVVVAVCDDGIEGAVAVGCSENNGVEL